MMLETRCEVRVVFQNDKPLHVGISGAFEHFKMAEKAAAGATGWEPRGICRCKGGEEFSLPANLRQLALHIALAVSAVWEVDDVASNVQLSSPFTLSPS